MELTVVWRYRLGLLLVTTSAVAWSTAGLFTRLIPLEIWTLLMWRGVFGALGIFLFLLVFERGRSLASFGKMGYAGWGFVVVCTAAMLCFIASLKLTSVAHASVIYATVPLLAAALAWFALREKPGTSALLASAAALVGVGIMVGLSTDGTLAGDLLAFCMTVCMAIMMVIARRFQAIPMLPAACLSAVLSIVVVAPFAQWNVPDLPDLVNLALFGVVNSALGLALFAIGSKMLPATETALIGALDAPLAPVWVLIAFGEVPGPATLAGGSIVFIAIVAHMLYGAGRAQTR